VIEEEETWRLDDRDGLLAAWSKHYASRPPEGERFLARAAFEDLEARLDIDATQKGYRYALTRESGAKYRAPFAPAMNLVFYCDASPRDVAKRLGLQPVEHGWNVEILHPPDDGVFYARRRVALGGNRDPDSSGLGRTIANDIYLYLDLWSHPARGKEQAEHLLGVIAAEPRPKSRTTNEESRFLEFLKLRDRAHEKMREGEWEEAVSLFDRSLREIVDLKDVQAETAKEDGRFYTWLSIEHLAREIWSNDRKRRKFLLGRIRREIPNDDEVLRRYPPYRLNPALVRYLLGTRRALLASARRGGEQEHDARVAAEHFKIAVSPYTDGANRVVQDVEKIRAWLRKEVKIDLVW
jgi:hypothetical protein